MAVSEILYLKPPTYRWLNSPQLLQMPLRPYVLVKSYWLFFFFKETKSPKLFSSDYGEQHKWEKKVQLEVANNLIFFSPYPQPWEHSAMKD